MSALGKARTYSEYCDKRIKCSSSVLCSGLCVCGGRAQYFGNWSHLSYSDYDCSIANIIRGEWYSRCKYFYWPANIFIVDCSSIYAIMNQ